MLKKKYVSPEAEYSLLWEQAIICDSYAGGIDDYDLVGDYNWQDE